MSNSGTLEIKYAALPNWFTSHGVYLKQKALAKEGFPMCDNWMMITLTIDQNQFSSPEEAYDFLLDSKNSGRNNRVAKYMRDVSAKLVSWGYFEEAKHCVSWRKLEFQTNGWPHWHIFTNILKRLTKPQLRTVCEMWSYGRVRYDKLDSNAHYAFKYAFKSPFKRAKFDPNGGMTIEESLMQSALPKWFADKYEIAEGKPFSYDRARFFQRSRNFLINHRDWLLSQGQRVRAYKVIKPVKPSLPKSSLRVIRVSERLSQHLSKVQITARNESGDYIESKIVQLNVPFHVYSETTLIPKLLKGSAVALRPHHYIVDNIDEDFLPPITKLKYKQICQQNKMTIRRARLHQAQLNLLRNMDSASKGELSVWRTGKTGKIIKLKENLS